MCDSVFCLKLPFIGSSLLNEILCPQVTPSRCLCQEACTDPVSLKPQS